jgi:glycerol-3-phosphate dehydrogenase (NAD(P)+)
MRIGVIGGGAWGTALANVAAANGGDVLLWALEPDVVDAVNRNHLNPVYLPGTPLAPAIRATGALGDMHDRDALLVVVPAQHLRGVLAQIPVGRTPLILCAKGIEAETHLLMSDVAPQVHPEAPIAVLSGPTFAREVAAGMPTAVTLACEDDALGADLARGIARPFFRPYLSTDVIGAEIGGAVKNVLAIACGVVEGRGLGQNARAALISRGFAEMTRFGLAKGARRETLAGLSGLGDLVLTCSSTSSRNFSLGLGIGQGKSAQDLLADRRSVAEGAFTAPVLREAANLLGVDMPVTGAVCALLSGQAEAAEVIEALLSRPIRSEA